MGHSHHQSLVKIFFTCTLVHADLAAIFLANGVYTVVLTHAISKYRISKGLASGVTKDVQDWLKYVHLASPSC